MKVFGKNPVPMMQPPSHPRFFSRSAARFLLAAALLLAALAPVTTQAGAQIYEPLADSVREALSAIVADAPVAPERIRRDPLAARWIDAQSERLTRRVPDPAEREELLATVYYESARAGLDPELVLGLIEVESGFRKYAVSTAGARGYMQVMPFWVGLIGTPQHNLFHLRTNLRYGCTILRHYLDLEKGDLYRALGRYNGSLGRPEYPNAVLATWRKYRQPELSPASLRR